MSKWPSVQAWVPIASGVIAGSYIFHLVDHAVVDGDWFHLVQIPLAIGVVALWYRFTHR